MGKSDLKPTLPTAFGRRKCVAHTLSRLFSHKARSAVKSPRATTFLLVQKGICGFTDWRSLSAPIRANNLLEARKVIVALIQLSAASRTDAVCPPNKRASIFLCEQRVIEALRSGVAASKPDRRTWANLLDCKERCFAHYKQSSSIGGTTMTPPKGCQCS